LRRIGGGAMRTLIRTIGEAPSIALGLLSGSYSTAEDFVREGFLEGLERRGIAARVVLAEVRAAYFSDASIVQRIRASVVEPARAEGLARVWLAGVSLGGLACLCHAARHGDVERMALFAPYPGTRELLREIDEAGGIERWDAAAKPLDPEREAWRWLRDHGPRAQRLDCWFASGDRFAAGQRRIAMRLPAAAVHEVAGEHEWKDWRGMWNDFLERNPP